MVVQKQWQHAGMAGGGRKRQRKDPGSAGLGVLPVQGPGGGRLGVPPAHGLVGTFTTPINNFATSLSNFITSVQNFNFFCNYTAARGELQLGLGN
jgi:hypothetical protein